VQPDYKTLASQGVTVALSADDPDLKNQLARARENGMNPAIWIPATSGADPKAYAQKMASIVQTYGPSSIIPNVEADGKGYAGTKGYSWSDEMMAEYSRYVPQGSGPPLSVSVMGEKDFNYGAYLNYGGDVQVETFGSKLTDHKDVNALHANLLDSGVPEDKITMLLAPGQDPQGWKGRTAAYTLDDMNPQQLAQWQGQAAGKTGGVGGPDVIGPASPYPDTPNLMGPRVTDAHNPAAVRYANQRLALLAKQGIHPKDFGLEGLDPTAQWRALSGIVGAKQALNSGHGGDYQVGANTSEPVKAFIQNILSGPPQNPPRGPNDGYSQVQAPRPNDGYSQVQPPAPGDGYTQVHDPGQEAIDQYNTTPLENVRTRQPDTSHVDAVRAAMAGLQHTRAAPGVVHASVDDLRRVGPMQKAIQVAAALRHVQQLRPTRGAQ